MSTEKRNPRSIGLDRMTAQQIVRLMNEEEHQVLRALHEAEGSLAVAAERVAQTFIEGGRIVYVGAGTSGRVAIMDAAEMPVTFGVPRDRFVAVVAGGFEASMSAVADAEDNEFLAIQALNDLKVTREDVIIVIAASGRTPFALAAAKHANQKGVWTCGIVNNKNAPLILEVDHAIVLNTGPEVLTGSTRLKAATAQKLALDRISTAAMVQSGKVIENLMVDVKPTSLKLKERCVQIVHELSTLTEDEARRLLEVNSWNVRHVLNMVRSVR